jgi:hypothetical protein
LWKVFGLAGGDHIGARGQRLDLVRRQHVLDGKVAVFFELGDL